MGVYVYIILGHNRYTGIASTVILQSSQVNFELHLRVQSSHGTTTRNSLLRNLGITAPAQSSKGLRATPAAQKGGTSCIVYAPEKDVTTRLTLYNIISVVSGDIRATL